MTKDMKKLLANEDGEVNELVGRFLDKVIAEGLESWEALALEVADDWEYEFNSAEQKKLAGALLNSTYIKYPKADRFLKHLKFAFKIRRGRGKA
jgi:hypothetical protein